MIVDILVSTKTRSKLSAVIPIANYELHKANIESILTSAASHDVEMILVLDSEPKKAYEDLVRLTKNLDNRHEVLTVSSGNPGSARNYGKRQATRDWVTFWDCDDHPIIDSILESIEEAEVINADICIGGYLVGDASTSSIKRVNLKKKNFETQIGINPGLWRMSFKRALITDVDFPELSMAEDQVFIQRVLNRNPKISYFYGDTYIYRVGIANQLTANPEKRLDLKRAHELSSREYNPRIKSRKITSTMLVRQELSILKYLNYSMKGRIKLIFSLIKKTFDVYRTLFFILESYLSDRANRKTKL
jgi:glycosyltransferase involved in cell wall biosynthesis